MDHQAVVAGPEPVTSSKRGRGAASFVILARKRLLRKKPDGRENMDRTGCESELQV
jgi:hypothetical protein